MYKYIQNLIYRIKINSYLFSTFVNIFHSNDII